MFSAFPQRLARHLSHRQIRPQLEALEDRLTPSWGGVPPATIAVPTSAVQVALNSSGDAQGAASITSNEIDYYTFTAATTGSYRLAASTPSSSVDTVLGVFNASGQRVAYNDDISSSNRDSQLTVNLTAGQRYYFGITNYNGTANGSYSWLVDGPTAAPPPPPADDAYENNDTFATARDLGTLTAQRTITGLVMADGQDWYRFTTNGAGTSANYVAISFQHAQGDLDLELVNASGTVVARSDSVANSERVALDGLAAGTYYVHVYGYNGAANPNYALAINPGTPAPPPPPPPPTGGFQIQLNITGMSASQTAIFQEAAARWQQIIVGDLPDATYNGVAVDDVLIDASGAAIDGAGGVLGRAGPDSLRSGSRLPIHGSMQFDTADLDRMEANGSLRNVIIHEMGHVLGIGTIWATKGLLTGAGGSDPRFIGVQATAEYNAIFHTNVTGVPVENTGGAGTRDGHWRESVFSNEIMTGWINGGSNPLSRITVASLADLGYTVNIAAADAYTPPAGTAAVQTVSSSGVVSSLLAGDDHSTGYLADWTAAAPTLRRVLSNLGTENGRATVANLAQGWRSVAQTAAAAFEPLAGWGLPEFQGIPWGLPTR